jgi:hypothetical protein
LTQQSIDFGTYESRYPWVFNLLRKAGWHERRFVDFVDVDTDPAGELRGELILHDYARAFLHAFYGLRVSVKTADGDIGFFVGFDETWGRMKFGEHGSGINKLANFDFPYPILSWESYVGFATASGASLAVDDCYQTYIKSHDPFELMQWILAPRNTPLAEVGYIKRECVPYEYWPMIYDRPLDYHLPRYAVYTITEGDKTDYILERTRDGVIALRVVQLTEKDRSLYVSYLLEDPNMHDYLAHRLILHKLLDEWFEERFRGRIQEVHFTNDRTGEGETLRWPAHA